MAVRDFSREGHHIVYIFLTLGVIVAGGLVLGYTDTNHAYDFKNSAGVTTIAMPFTGTCPGIDCTTTPGVAKITFSADTVVTGIDFDKATLDYSATDAGRGLIAGGILAVVIGSLLFLISVGLISWHQNNPEPCVAGTQKSGSMLRS